MKPVFVWILVYSSFLASCHEKENGKIDLRQGNNIEEEVNVSTENVISAQDALKCLETYGMLGSFCNRERSNKIIEHYNRYLHGDESIKDFAYISEIYDLYDVIPESCIRFFIKKGANLNTKNQYCETPLHLSVNRSHMEIAQMLLTNNVDPNVKDSKGRTPLYLGAANGCLEIVQLLLNYKANPNTLNEKDETSLFWAIRRSHKKMTRLFLEHGANPNVKNKDKETP